MFFITRRKKNERVFVAYEPRGFILSSIYQKCENSGTVLCEWFGRLVRADQWRPQSPASSLARQGGDRPDRHGRYYGDGRGGRRRDPKEGAATESRVRCCSTLARCSHLRKWSLLNKGPHIPTRCVRWKGGDEKDDGAEDGKGAGGWWWATLNVFDARFLVYELLACLQTRASFMRTSLNVLPVCNKTGCFVFLSILLTRKWPWNFVMAFL